MKGRRIESPGIDEGLPGSVRTNADGTFVDRELALLDSKALADLDIDSGGMDRNFGQGGGSIDGDFLGCSSNAESSSRSERERAGTPEGREVV